MNSADTQTTIYRADYKEPAYQITKVNFEFDIDAASTRVTTDFAMTQSRAEPLVLVGQNLSLQSVAIDGETLSEDKYSVDEDSLTIPNLPASFNLRTVVDTQPEKNTALEGLYSSGDFLLTQCEAEGFRKITYFLDRPDVMTTYTVRLNADKSRFPILLSNGNLSESGDLDNGRHFAVWEDPFPKPSYLFALVAGDLAYVEDHYTTSEGRKVALRIYVEEQNLGKVDHAMLSLKNSMKWDEDRFGLAYDLDVYNIVATNDFNMGAMENKSLNIFNSKYVLADVDSATDADFLAIEAVIGHEYFHNWTGNRVTCRDWFQLSLKEGLTVFRDQEFSSDMQSRAVKRIADVRLLRSRQYSEDAGPMAHPVRPDSFVEINNFYTATIYIKGAEVVRMYHTLLGEELFQKGMKLYFERHDGQAVTCDDFRAAMSDASGVDLEQFESWYKQAGTPFVKVRGEYDAEKKTYTLHFHQSTPDTPGQSDKPPHHMPVRLGLVAKDGSDMPLALASGSLSKAGDGVELRAREESFVFTGIDHKPVPSLFRGLSAPIKLDFEYEQEELAFLMANDSDSFNRWDASQTLVTQLILQMIASGSEDVSVLYLDAVGVLLGDQSDPGFVAEALRLPDESYLAGVMADHDLVADVDGIHKARTKIRAAIAKIHAKKLATSYAELDTSGPYDLSPESVAKRSLKNVLLSYLCAGGEFSQAQAQFENASNMSDSISALSALVHAGAPSSDAALGVFLNRWQEDPLVTDKWLTVQAICSQPGALERVDALLKHPVFEIKNPNKVYSLINAFGRSNPVQFHAADGSGYRWMAAQVAHIDSFNPQVASRLVRAFDPWRQYDEGRQAHAKAALTSLQDGELSPDVREIVTKATQ